MSSFTVSETCSLKICIGWIRKNHRQIQNHPAWHENITEAEAESLLKRKSPFTYLLRSGGQERSYFISFVQENYSIKHQYFTLEFDRKGWFYRNGEVQGPKEVVAQSLNDLIPQMMHCDLKGCRVLKKSDGIGFFI